MTVFDVRKASRHQCGQIARRIRKGHWSATIRLGSNVHADIVMAFDLSTEAFAWTADGRVIAIGGIIGPMVSTTGVIWLAMSSDGERYPIEMVKTALRWLHYFGENRRSLRTTVALDDKAAVRFAERLGFRPTGDVIEDGKIAIMARNCGGD